MSAESESSIKEVFIVKRSTKMDSEEFVSIQLKSSEDSIEALLQKAITASDPPTSEKNPNKVGIQ
jgi:hypothetical protein